jgi:hypothetical protein
MHLLPWSSFALGRHASSSFTRMNFRDRFFAYFAPIFLLSVLVPGARAQKTATTTTLALTTSSGPATSVPSGTVVTLTATVIPVSGTIPAGQVNFCDASATYCTDIHLLGMAQLTSAGTATLKFRPGIGSHSYKAAFLGTHTYAGSSSSGSALTVTGTFPTTTTITLGGDVGNYTLTANVTGVVSAQNIAAPTGTVSFLNTSASNSVLGTADLGAGTTGLSFVNSSNPATMAEPNAIAAADFNGDGIPDLAVSNSNSNLTTLTILLGNMDGTFIAETTSPTVGLYPDSIAVGDFNGDGIPDLAVTSIDNNNVTILLGNGDGTFRTSATLGANTPQSVATGDFNEDGIADLAVVSSESVLVFLGNEEGTFQQQSASVTVGASPITVAVGDFNSDGMPDLAVTNNCGSSYPCNSNDPITIALGNGDGTFTQAPVVPSLPTGANPDGLAVGDFNGDGILDLAVSNPLAEDLTDAIYIFLGNGEGAFKSPVGYPVLESPSRPGRGR